MAIVLHSISLFFDEYQRLAKKYDHKVIAYYVVSGHGKGLIDAMSAFGIKTLLR